MQIVDEASLNEAPPPRVRPEVLAQRQAEAQARQTTGTGLGGIANQGRGQGRRTQNLAKQRADIELAIASGEVDADDLGDDWVMDPDNPGAVVQAPATRPGRTPQAAGEEGEVVTAMDPAEVDTWFKDDPAYTPMTRVLDQLPDEVGGGDIADVSARVDQSLPDEVGGGDIADTQALAKMKANAGITGAGVADAEKTIGAPIGSGGITAADNAGTPQDAGDAGEAGVLAKQQADATAAANVDDFSGIKKAQMKTSTRNAQAQAADATAAANVDDFSGMATADAARKDRDAAANVDDFSGMGKAADQVAAANVDDFSGMAGAERQTAARAMGDVEGGVTTALAKPKASNLPNTPPPGTGTQKADAVAKPKAGGIAAGVAAAEKKMGAPKGSGNIAKASQAATAQANDRKQAMPTKTTPQAVAAKPAVAPPATVTPPREQMSKSTGPLKTPALTKAPKQVGRENDGGEVGGVMKSTILKGKPGTTPDRGDINPADRPKVDPAIAAKKAADMKARLAAQEKREMNADR